MATAERFADPQVQRIVLHSLERMAAGGIYDQIGGGFHRYATDAEWRVPHFEKMLYNQAHFGAAVLAGVRTDGETTAGGGWQRIFFALWRGR